MHTLHRLQSKANPSVDQVQHLFEHYSNGILPFVLHIYGSLRTSHSITFVNTYRLTSNLPPLNERTVRNELNTSWTIWFAFAYTLNSLIACLAVNFRR